MALDLFSDNWASWPSSPPASTVVSSPRISFSCDVDGSEDHDRQHRSDDSLAVVGSPSSSDFDFCVARDRSEQDSSAADELFSDGFLLPLYFLTKGASSSGDTTGNTILPNLNTTTTTTVGNKSGNSSSSSSNNPVGYVSTPTTLQVPNKKENQKEVVAVPGGVHNNSGVGKQPTSFWRFGRSSSLNYWGSTGGVAAGGRRSGLICSLPLLSRSKSTGSNPVPPATKPRLQHQHSATGTVAASASSNSKLSRKGSSNGGSTARSPYYYGQQHHGSAGVRISPILNVPPPYIPRGSSAGIFSLGHLLCSGKDKSRKRTQLPPPP